MNKNKTHTIHTFIGLPRHVQEMTALKQYAAAEYLPYRDDDQISTRILWVFYVSADYAMSVHTFYPVCVMQCDVSGPFAIAELFVKIFCFTAFTYCKPFKCDFFRIHLCVILTKFQSTAASRNS